MMDFLEECKVRFTEVQKRVQQTQQELQAAQGRHQAALQEANSLQFMIHTETIRLQQNNTIPVPTEPKAIPADVASNQLEVNKTDMIRDLLSRHPTGMTPTEIWREVKSQMTHRAYLYSVLGRLKDRDEVTVRRKKYFLRVVTKPAEGKEQQGSIVN